MDEKQTPTPSEQTEVAPAPDTADDQSTNPVVAFVTGHLMPFGQTFMKEFQEDNVPILSSSLAYFSLFSLFPLLLVIISVSSFFVGSPDSPLRASLRTVSGGELSEENAAQLDANQQIIDFLNNYISEDVASQIEGVLAGLYESRGQATLIGIVTLFFSASGVFASLDRSFQIIWDLDEQEKPQQGIANTVLNLVLRRAIAFGLVLAAAALLLISMVAGIAINIVRSFIEQGVTWVPVEMDELPGGDMLWNGVYLGTTFLLLTLMFMLLFRFLPEVKIKWSDVLPGAVLTGVLFVLFLNLSSYLVGSNNFQAYGAVGSMMTVLLWIFFSSMALFAGVEFTQVYTMMYGSLRPTPAEAIATEDNAPTPAISSENAT